MYSGLAISSGPLHVPILVLVMYCSGRASVVVVVVVGLHLFLKHSCCLTKLGRRQRTAICCSEAQLASVLPHGGSVQVFREQVGGIVSPRHLGNLKLLVSHLLLEPEVSDIYMTQLAKPLSIDNSQGCGCIAVDYSV